MNKKILGFIFAVALLLPAGLAQAKEHGEFKDKMKAHHAEQEKENKAFRDSIKDLDPEARRAAITKHREEQFQENVAHHEKLHQEKMQKLRAKLDSSDKFTAEQKTQMLTEAEDKYQEMVEHHKTQHAENIEKFNNIVSDEHLTPEQKKAAMKEHRLEQKSENKELREKMKQERKERRNERKEAIK